MLRELNSVGIDKCAPLSDIISATATFLFLISAAYLMPSLISIALSKLLPVAIHERMHALTITSHIRSHVFSLLHFTEVARQYLNTKLYSIMGCELCDSEETSLVHIYITFSTSVVDCDEKLPALSVRLYSFYENILFLTAR
jgi:hypothetical protein